MADYSEQISRTWKEGQEIDVHNEMNRLILRIVGKTVFDADVLSEADALGSALTKAICGFNSQVRAFIPLAINWPTLKNIGYRRAVQRLNRTVRELINLRRLDDSDHRDLLTMLMQARYDDGAAMTDKQIRDEAVTMFMLGYETSASALTWTWFLLSENPKAYERMRYEVDSVLRGRTPTFADLLDLPYTLQVFKEGLRLYPSVYMFSCRAVRSVDIDGYYFPAGSILVFSPFSMHRSPDYFPEPELFDPDRFSRKNEALLPMHAYMPFGAGRICIGNRCAMLNGHMVLATLAQRVTLHTWQPLPERNPMVTLRPKRPIRMLVKHRSGSKVRKLQPQASVYASAAAVCPFSSGSGHERLDATPRDAS